MLFKKMKMGQLPGDLSRWTKIRMLEGDVPLALGEEDAKSFKKCAKSFKRDHVKRANRNFRRGNKMAG